MCRLLDQKCVLKVVLKVGIKNNISIKGEEISGKIVDTFKSRWHVRNKTFVLIEYFIN